MNDIERRLTDMPVADNCPCYQCKNRCVGCHSTCEKYKEWRAKQDNIREKERKTINTYWLGRNKHGW